MPAGLSILFGMLSYNQKLICLGNQKPVTLNLDPRKYGGHDFWERVDTTFSGDRAVWEKVHMN